jgi:hypothetical protein
MLIAARFRLAAMIFPFPVSPAPVRFILRSGGK